MKKFGVVISFFIIIIIFVGLNYLLWERESREKDIKNLQDSSTSSILTINALNRQIENLENTLTARNDSLEKTNKENDDLRKDIEGLKQENIRFHNIIKNKTIVLNNLYNNLGQLDYIDGVINKWAEYISKQEYTKAYELWSEEEESTETLDEFTNKYKNIVNSIKVNSVEISRIDISKKADDELVNKKVIDEYEKGDLFLSVELDVNLAEWAAKYDTIFDHGINKSIFILKYSEKSGKWHITDIRKPM